jgi:hypothetical protein
MVSRGTDYADGDGLTAIGDPSGQDGRAVGWLGTPEGDLPQFADLSQDELWARIYPYRRGGKPELGDRLDAAIEASWDGTRDRKRPLSVLVMHRGMHECELCIADKSGTSELGNGVYRLAAIDDGPDFVFPQMIGHYVRVHGYLPPREFLAAFERSFPPPAQHDRAG